MANDTAQFGMIGMAVMGRNLASTSSTAAPVCPSTIAIRRRSTKQ